MAAWLCLVDGWCATALIAPYGDKLLWIWPVMDAFFGTFVMTMAKRRHCRWAALLGLTFLGQMAMHVTYNLMSVELPTDPHRVYRYYLAVNLVMVAQMVCVSWPGAVNAGSILVGQFGRFSRHRGRKELAP